MDVMTWLTIVTIAIPIVAVIGIGVVLVVEERRQERRRTPMRRHKDTGRQTA